LYPVVLTQAQVEAHFAASDNQRPVAPETVEATSDADNRATVTWTPITVPVPQGQAAVDHYLVTALLDDAPVRVLSVGGSQTSALLRGLPEGEAYRFEVSAVNGFGEGPAGASPTIVVGGVAATYSAAILADAPSHYYRMGETSGTMAADSAGADRHGQYNGATLNQTSALAVDDDPSVLFPQAGTSRSMSALPGSGGGLATGDTSRTVEAWVKTTTPTESVRIASWGTFPNAFDVGMNGSHVTVTWSSGSNNIWIQTDRALNDGKWHHVALTYDGTTTPNTFTVYVDGELRNQVTRAADLTTSWSLPSFGSSGAQLQHLWLDEVALYPVVLTQAQVEAHFAASGNQRPVAPDTVEATSDADNRATVIWSPVTVSAPPGQAAVDHYVITAKRDGVSKGAVSVAGSQTSVVVRGVPAGDYEIEVYAVNGFGRGPAGVSSTVAIGGAGVTYSSSVLADSPSHLYRLGEASGSLAADSSGFDRHGQYNGATLNRAGAIQADTDTAVLFPVSGSSRSMSALPGSGGGLATGDTSRTVEAWVKTTTGQSVRIAGWGTIPNGFDVRMQGSNVTVTWSSGGSNTLAINTGVPLNDGQWHHVVLTYDGAASPNLFTVYVDGQRRNQTTRSTDFATSWTLPSFGSSGALGDHIYLDEVALYPRVLTNHQVLEHWVYSSAVPRVGRSKGALS